MNRLRLFFSGKIAGLLLSVLLTLPLTPAAAKACTIFSISSKGNVVVGRNLDWRKPLPGRVVVNRREVRKAVLSWKGSWPDSAGEDTVFWISRYGSVSFTCYGRDFIESGMNEKGLVVTEASFQAEYPPQDSRPGISCAQWLQYQLDNYATVSEVLSHLEELRPDGEGWHYLIADRTGDCAVIEYIDGRAAVFTGEEAPVKVITNTAYRQGLSHLPMDIRFGGHVDIGAEKDSYGRFVRAAAFIDRFDPERHGPLSGYALKALADLSDSTTRRSVVYDTDSLKVLWTTADNRRLRRIEMKRPGLFEMKSARVLDIDAGDEGEIYSLLKEYRTEYNLAVTASVLSNVSTGDGTEALLAKRGLTLKEAIAKIAGHPAKYSP